MKSTLETVAFFKNLRQTLEALSDEDAGALMKALFAFDDGETPDLSEKSASVKALFPLVSDTLDRLTKKRMNKVRPQTDRNDTANEPQTDRNDTAHNHSHNHSHSPYHNQSQDHSHNQPAKAGNKESVHFVPPTIRDVEDYAFEKGLNIDAERFVNYYASKGWMVGRTKMKDWKAAARNWAARDKKPAGGFETFSAMCDEGDGMKVWDAI